VARTYVIGDIHGACRALQQVIRRVAPSTGGPAHLFGRLCGWVVGIAAGDGVPDGIEMPPIIAFLFAATTTPGVRNGSLGWGPDPNWLFHGGRATVESYAGISAMQTIRHLAFFARMRLILKRRGGFLFMPASPPCMAPPRSITKAITSGTGPYGRWRCPSMTGSLKTVFSIHDDCCFTRRSISVILPLPILTGIFPCIAANVWNMDTGAAFTGRISMMDIETKKVTQSDIVQKLYPGESGRNK